VLSRKANLVQAHLIIVSKVLGDWSVDGQACTEEKLRGDDNLLALDPSVLKGLA